MRRVVVGVVAGCLAGCSLVLGLEQPTLLAPPDAAGPDADLPALVPGGGATGGPVAGRLAVYVVDELGRQALPGANVRVGTALAAMTLEGTTDDDGLVVFTAASLTGPQTVTVSATGYAASTWIGIDAAELTIPIVQSPRPSATITGTINDWSSLSPPAGDFYLGLVTSSTRLGDAGPPFLQPLSGGRPQNTCYRSMPTSVCNFVLTTRPGPQRLIATIYYVDSQNTAPTSDDVFSVVEWATADIPSLAPGETLGNVTLQRAPGSDTVTFDGSASTLPASLPAAGFNFILDLDREERLVGVGLPPMAALTASFPVIRPGSATATGIGLAGYNLLVGVFPAPHVVMPNSRAWRGGIDLGQAQTVSSWIGAPADLSASGGNYAFTAASGANFYFVDIVSGDQVRWRVLIFDGSTSFRLPAASPDPLPVGTTATMTVNAAALPGFQPDNFSVLIARTAPTHISQATLDFTR